MHAASTCSKMPTTMSRHRSNILLRALLRNEAHAGARARQCGGAARIIARLGESRRRKTTGGDPDGALAACQENRRVPQQAHIGFEDAFFVGA
jgi:hypothetical protein